MKQRWIVIIVLALVVIGGVAARHSFQRASAVARSSAAPPAIPVNADVAKREDVPAYVQAIGTVQSIDSVNVQPRVNGQIEQIFFKAGQEVKKGQPLFQIDPRPYQAALDQAQAQLAHDRAVLQEAQTDLTRYQGLAKTKAIPEQQADDQAYIVRQDQGTVQLDQANVETAKLNVEYCHIASPIDGRAGALLVDLGNMVQTTTATTLVSIAKVRPIYVSFSIPQTMLDEVRENQTKGALEVEARSESGKIGAGTLTLIDNQVSTGTGTVKLQGTFPNDDEALWPGQFMTIRLTLFTRQNATTVPARAVMLGPDGSYVYVIDPDDTVRRVDVDVVSRQDNIAVIGKGLDGGERIVTDGQYRLAENVKVQIKSSNRTASNPTR